MNVAAAVDALLRFGAANGLPHVGETEPLWRLLAESFHDRDVRELDPAALERFLVDGGFGAEQAHTWFQAKQDAWSRAYGPDGSFRDKWGATTPCDALRAWYEGRAEPPRRALDLGCGDGVNAIYMASWGTEVDAFDLSPAAAELVRRRAAEAGVAVRAHVGSAHDLRQVEGEYDLVFDRGCFHHVPLVFWHLYKQAVHARLAEDGTFLLLCHAPRVFADRWLHLYLGCFGRLLRFVCDGVAESSFTASDLEAIFCDRFEILEHRRAPDHEGRPFEFNVCTLRRRNP